MPLHFKRLKLAAVKLGCGVVVSLNVLFIGYSDRVQRSSVN